MNAFKVALPNHRDNPTKSLSIQFIDKGFLGGTRSKTDIPANNTVLYHTSSWVQNPSTAHLRVKEKKNAYQKLSIHLKGSPSQGNRCFSLGPVSWGPSKAGTIWPPLVAATIPGAVLARVWLVTPRRKEMLYLAEMRDAVWCGRLGSFGPQTSNLQRLETQKCWEETQVSQMVSNGFYCGLPCLICLLFQGFVI